MPPPPRPEVRKWLTGGWLAAWFLVFFLRILSRLRLRLHLLLRLPSDKSAAAVLCVTFVCISAEGQFCVFLLLWDVEILLVAYCTRKTSESGERLGGVTLNVMEQNRRERGRIRWYTYKVREAGEQR